VRSEEQGKQGKQREQGVQGKQRETQKFNSKLEAFLQL
jgi:hypothetical protein